MGLIDVAELARIVNADDSGDLDLQQVADATERFTVRYTGRLLQPDPALVEEGDPPVATDTAPPVTKRIIVRNRRFVRVPDVRAVTALTLDGTAVVAQDFELVGSSDGPWPLIEILSSARGRVAEVTGRFGFLTPPEDLYRAMLELAARRVYEQSAGFVDSTQSDAFGGRQYVKQMPSPVRLVLDSYVVPSDRLALT